MPESILSRCGPQAAPAAKRLPSYLVPSRLLLKAGDEPPDRGPQRLPASDAQAFAADRDLAGPFRGPAA